MCVLSFSFNLIYVKRLTENLTTCLFFLSNRCFIMDLFTWNTIGIVEVKCNVYQLLHAAVPLAALANALSHLSPLFPSITVSIKNSNYINDLWHCRLAHISDSTLTLIKDPIVRITSFQI